jgi:hypothetical protein
MEISKKSLNTSWHTGSLPGGNGAYDSLRLSKKVRADWEPDLKWLLIPSALEDAMSMQAQAERERQARVILGDSERQVAEKFGEAARTYANDPIALHLRAMNMLYEGLKDNATIVIVPSTAVETMQLGSRRIRHENLTDQRRKGNEPAYDSLRTHSGYPYRPGLFLVFDFWADHLDDGRRVLPG